MCIQITLLKVGSEEERRNEGIAREERWVEGGLSFNYG